MKVTILESANYSDFNTRNLDAKWLRIGTVAEFPQGYTEGLIKAGLAEAYQEPEPEPAADPVGGNGESESTEAEPAAPVVDSGVPVKKPARKKK